MTKAEARLIEAAVISYDLLLKVREPDCADAIHDAYSLAGKRMEYAVRDVVRERGKKR